MSIEKLNIVSEILHEHQNLISFNGNHFIGTGNILKLETDCASKGIDTDKLADTLTLTISSLISPNLILFNQIATHFEATFTKEEFSIVKTNGEYCYHSKVNEELVFSNNATNDFKIICQNTFCYYKLYNYFKSKEFCDHHDSANKEIVLYNSAKGIFKIKYDSVPRIDKTTNIKSKVDDLILMATSVELNSFLKNSLVPFANGKDSISFQEIISNASDIISTTKRDYALVSKQFDFEKFRDSLYKEKEKYFSNIREIINKIFSQAVGIPISISAVVFATYKVSDDTLMLLLVMLSFIVYVFFYVKIQLVYKSDIKEIETDFNNDFDIIISKSGLQPDIINKEKEKIKTKISSSLTMLNYLIGTVIFLGLLVCWYIFYEIGKSETFCLIKLIMKLF